MDRPVILPDEKAKKAVKLLEKEYPGTKYYLDFNTPIDLLVAAILSAQTRDTVVNAVTPELFKKYKTAKDYADASEMSLLKSIDRVTFAENKAKNIIKACTIISEKYSGVVPDKMDALLALPGVGRKTANTILINAYGIVEGIPVDTWVIKLSYRIGLSAEKNPDDIEKDLERIVDKDSWKNIAYVMKAHGHKICKSIVPLCSGCVIKDICPRNGVKKSG